MIHLGQLLSPADLEDPACLWMYSLRHPASHGCRGLPKGSPKKDPNGWPFVKGHWGGPFTTIGLLDGVVFLGDLLAFL